MATETDLAGLGMAGPLAAKLGNQPNGPVAGTGTTQTGATVIKTKDTSLNAQAGATAFQLPSTADIGSPYWVSNATISTTSALVFVPVGDIAVNTVQTSGVLNGAFTVAQGAAAVLFQAYTVGAVGYWYAK